MEIKMQICGRIYSICIGYKTAWFRSLYFITVTREWYGNDMRVDSAEMIFKL